MLCSRLLETRSNGMDDLMFPAVHTQSLQYWPNLVRCNYGPSQASHGDLNQPGVLILTCFPSV